MLEGLLITPDPLRDIGRAKQNSPISLLSDLGHFGP